MSTDRYSSPLSERYASKEMQYIFSQDMKFSTWRKLWIALAETEMELGLSENGKPVITQEQIDEMKEHVYDINYDVAKEREKLVRHDVMSHVYAFGQQCPKAAGIIHLGATSCYVGDNTDIIIMNEALKLVHKKLVNVIAELAKFADTYKNLPTLAFTHFQPAQPTTVGKRATLWTQEFLMDLEDLEYVMGTLKLLGSKGTTGTQASFLELFEGDQETIDKIDPMIAAKMGFKECYAVSGQTYSRKVDTRVANILAGIAASAHKMSNDIRLLHTFSPLFENVPDNVIFRGADFRGEHAGLMGLGWLYNDLKEEKFDAVAAFQPTFRSRFLCWRFRLAGIKAAHIKQNRRELQKLIRRKHKIYTEQDSFFQRCAHTLNQIGYPIRLSFLSLFGKNKGNISSLAPLTGEKNQETWIGIAPFATHVGKIYPLSKQEQILKHLSARDHTKIFLFGGGKKEIKVLEEWAQHFPNVISTAGKLTINMELCVAGTESA